MKIHHIGYLVDRIESSAKEFEKLGFLRTSKTVEDMSREIYILFLDNAGQVVELIQPVSKTSPVNGLRKSHRNSPYHICYETDDLQAAIGKMTIEGYIVIQPPSPAPAIPGCPNVAFLMGRYVGMIELVEIKE